MSTTYFQKVPHPDGFYFVVIDRAAERQFNDIPAKCCASVYDPEAAKHIAHSAWFHVEARDLLQQALSTLDPSTHLARKIRKLLNPESE